MKASISKSEICGKAAAPSSKSYTIRGLICAALSEGKSEIISPLASDDTAAATFNNPEGAAVDASGNVYCADSNNHTIRKISAAGW